jgi:arginyl-tRNA synthetase
MHFRSQVVALLKKHHVDAEHLLEVPPDAKLGDFALPCFSFAKEHKKAPGAIAHELAAKLEAPFLEKVVATGPYVNFFIQPQARAVGIIEAVDNGTIWGKHKAGKTVLVEYPSPNTNKPLHLGHVRNMVLGSTVATVLKADGNNVVQVNLNNDRGVHICKSMLAYERWGNGAEPDKKSDHFVGDFYVLFEKQKQQDATLDAQAQEMLVKWEHGDPHVRALWEKMNAWAINGFHETYARYAVAFDKEYFESAIYEEGKRIVLDNEDKFVRDEETGALVAPLKHFNLPDKVLLRKDGTSIYITQDIALTMQKIQDFDPDLQVWVVANEQNMHFQQLFAIMELLGVHKRSSFHHLSYGMVSLPEGRMKSREGRVVDADDILDELETGAAEEIRKRHTEWTEERVQETSRVLALGALRFFMIKFDAAKDFTFNPQSSLSFEGDTGPYVQYTHARIASVLRKAEWPSSADAALLVAPEEQELLRQMSFLSSAFREAVHFKPHTLANQVLEVARAANSFYHACPVLQAEPALRDARLYLLGTTQKVIAEGLALLGISAPQEM